MCHTHIHMYLNLNLNLYMFRVQQNIIREDFHLGIFNLVTASFYCINRRVLFKPKLWMPFQGWCLVESKYYNEIANNYCITIHFHIKSMFIWCSIKIVQGKRKKLKEYFYIIEKSSFCCLVFRYICLYLVHIYILLS